jgi:phage baseplate assembly protein gpV
MVFLVALVGCSTMEPTSNSSSTVSSSSSSSSSGEVLEKGVYASFNTGTYNTTDSRANLYVEGSIVHFDFDYSTRQSWVNDLNIDNQTNITAGGYWYNGSTTVACYWYATNSSPVTLTNIKSEVTKIVVTGQYIYAYGFYYNGSVNVECYWKINTNTTTILSLVTNFRGMVVHNFNANNEDVYLAGWTNGFSAILKNTSELTYITNQASTVYASYIEGTDLYYAGATNNNKVSYIWKNGTLTSLELGTDYTNQINVTSIDKENLDVYVLGYGYNGVSQEKTIVWKNSSIVNYLDGDPIDFDISTSKVYVAANNLNKGYFYVDSSKIEITNVNSYVTSIKVVK